MHPVTFRNPFDRTSQPLHTVVVIPARYESTRLPGKPLSDIAGQPMIAHVYRRAAVARGIDAVIVATDDPRIVDAVEAIGGIARLTARAHRTGTDRIAELARELACEIVVNVQGDEPLIEAAMIEQAIEPFDADPSVLMTTLRSEIRDPADHRKPNVVKVVVDREGDALYFSRAPIPGAFKHVGLYAYRRSFLIEFSQLPQTRLELTESLEQLRALEHGYRIRTVETQHESIGVDTPEDLERVRRLLTADART